MRTARFIGSWLAGLIALALAVLLFVQWIQFALGAAGTGTPAPLFLWIAFGVNLLVWSFVGLLRLGDDSVRALLRSRAAPRRERAGAAGRPGGGDAAAVGADRVLVRSRTAVGRGGTAGSAGEGPVPAADPAPVPDPAGSPGTRPDPNR